MSEGTSMTVFGDLAGPAKVLIEKIADACGALWQPRQIKRVAKAEAEAEKIAALAEIEITLMQRALRRFVAEEALKQENMESITAKAIPLLEDSAMPQNMENDWISNFFDKCRIVSDDEMQTLWGKVLAGEANAPGTFSKRTVNFLSSISKDEAHLFTSLCGFCWEISPRHPEALVLDVDEQIYDEKGINFGTLTLLGDIGLVRFDPLAGVSKRRLPRFIEVRYYGKPFVLEFAGKQNNTLDLGKILLSKTGRELAPICGSQPVDGFIEYVLEKWVGRGIAVSSNYHYSPETE